MKRKIIKRIVFGFPIGIATGYLITIFISLCMADGTYAPCVPDLISVTGSEINAVVLQAALCGILGSGFAASSVIWKIDSWGIVKQTGIYFLIISVIMLPIAYFSYWMEHTLIGFLSYYGIFITIFIFVWIIQFFVGKHNVKKLNEKLNRNNGSSSEQNPK